jgi:ferredoxin
MSRVRPYVVPARCRQCEQCVEICPYDVFETDNGSVVVAHPEECIECTACVDTCPYDAIVMDD